MVIPCPALLAAVLPVPVPELDEPHAVRSAVPTSGAAAAAATPAPEWQRPRRRRKCLAHRGRERIPSPVSHHRRRRAGGGTPMRAEVFQAWRSAQGATGMDGSVHAQGRQSRPSWVL